MRCEASIILLDCFEGTVGALHFNALLIVVHFMRSEHTTDIFIFGVAGLCVSIAHRSPSSHITKPLWRHTDLPRVQNQNLDSMLRLEKVQQHKTQQASYSLVLQQTVWFSACFAAFYFTKLLPVIKSRPDIYYCPASCSATLSFSLLSFHC